MDYLYVRSESVDYLYVRSGRRTSSKYSLKYDRRESLFVVY